MERHETKHRRPVPQQRLTRKFKKIHVPSFGSHSTSHLNLIKLANLVALRAHRLLDKPWQLTVSKTLGTSRLNKQKTFALIIFVQALFNSPLLNCRTFSPFANELVNKMAGYHRQIFHLPILVKMPFKEIKKFFSNILFIIHSKFFQVPKFSDFSPKIPHNESGKDTFKK